MLNCKKTQSIFIGTRNLLSAIPDDMTINFDGSNIPIWNNVKILGVYFDRHMTFDTHIHQLTNKVTGILMFINRVKDLFDKDTRLIVVHTLALSVINNGLKIWGNTKETLMQQLQKLQNFVTKVAVGGYKRHDHATPVIKELKWLKIKEKVNFDQCLMVHKVIHKHCPEWLITVPSVWQINECRTRQNQDLFVPRVKTDNGARSLLVSGPKAWNKLPHM